ncbi:MAG: DoxX family protein [Candidatus Dormibacteraeota bacterium]|nr:DoxX family protein [Candidatus Dormibacteraeota bacterium]
MNIALWIAAGLLALVFLASGSLKLARPRAALAGRMGYVEDFSDVQVKGIGALEVLAAIGLIGPAVLHLATFLTPLAAVGLIAVMLGAAATHLRRREPSLIVVNVVLLALAAFVAWGRFGPYPL